MNKVSTNPSRAGGGEGGGGGGEKISAVFSSEKCGVQWDILLSLFTCAGFRLAPSKL